MQLDQLVDQLAQWVLTAVLLEIALSCMAVVGAAHSRNSQKPPSAAEIGLGSQYLRVIPKVRLIGL